MKKVIRFLIISLAPIIIFIGYPNLYLFARTYMSTHYVILPLIITAIAGYALIGTGIFFICKNTLKEVNPARIPVEFLIGIVLVVFPMISIYIGVSLPMFFFPDMGIGMSLIGLFIGIYVCLFVILLRHRAKALKVKKQAQNVQPPV